MVNAQRDPAALRVSEALLMLDMEQRDVLLALHYANVKLGSIDESLQQQLGTIVQH